VKKIDAVLPLTEGDLERSKALLLTIEYFFTDIGTLWIVVPDKQRDKIASELQKPNYKIIPESQLVPELKFYRNKKIGWQIQQLLKLAIAKLIESDFYLTFDADVLCLKPVCYDDLIISGRALANVSNHDWHPTWYAWSERVLDIKRSGLTHGVTPSIFNRSAVLELQKYLSQRYAADIDEHGKLLLHSRNLKFFAARLLRLQPFFKQYILSWRSYLLISRPWTEYSLYNTFLEGTEKWEKHHIASGEDSIYSNNESIWSGKKVPTHLNLSNIKLPDRCFFIVIQSTTKTDPKWIYDAAKKYIASVE